MTLVLAAAVKNTRIATAQGRRKQPIIVVILSKAKDLLKEISRL